MSAVEQLIDLAERLKPTGEIGDGMVAQFHDLAARARVEQHRARYPKIAAAWSGGGCSPTFRQHLDDIDARRGR